MGHGEGLRVGVLVGTKVIGDSEGLKVIGWLNVVEGTSEGSLLGACVSKLVAADNKKSIKT